MATVDAEIERLQFMSRNGRGGALIHVVDIEEEAKKRAENKPDEQGKQKTRFIFETDDPEMYKRFNAQKDRWLKGRNKSVVVDLMCRVWENVTDEDIQSWTSE